MLVWLGQRQHLEDFPVWTSQSHIGFVLEKDRIDYIKSGNFRST